ncbi:MAG: serine protease [Thermodesulfobacteriota bacterium]
MLMTIGCPLDPLSLVSLRLELLGRGCSLGFATGFVIKWNDKAYLITNWHVLSGKHPETYAALSSTGDIPDEVRINHHSKKIMSWVTHTEPLLDSQGHPRWLELFSKTRLDVVALPLREQDDEIQLYLLDLALANTDIIPMVAMPVSTIGFPMGMVASFSLPIWKTGHIASDFGWYYQDKPAFLIDATTRPGMSGAPVFLRVFGGYVTSSGQYVIAQQSGGVSTRFLGIYSGRVHNESEIGTVWYPDVISRILEQKASATP